VEVRPFLENSTNWAMAPLTKLCYNSFNLALGMMIMREKFTDINRLVIKVGTRVLTHETGKLNLHRIESLVREVADLTNSGREVILVSSGAVGAGMGKLGLNEKPKTIPEKQAAAAVGQGLMMHIYEKLFAEYGLVVAQVLLTREDVADRRRYLNARNALFRLLQFGVVPIVNENDTIAIEEIRLGDNDTLSAMVAGLADAGLLIILSDIEGLYTSNPRENSAAQLISEVEEITPEIEILAGGAGTKMGTGGMVTKIQAARIAASFGIPMVITHGKKTGALRRVVAGDPCGTLFLPGEHKPAAKKRWIAFGSNIKGSITVDQGAYEAVIKHGRSLLPIGVVDAQGEFHTGNVISILSPQGDEFARGITNYHLEELIKIKGKNSSDIENILGYKDFDEVIHRDNLAVRV